MDTATGRATEQKSFCRICAAACGIVVEVDGGTVLRVRGDAEHPVSRGYTCAKGRALPSMHHRSDRLSAPRLHGSEASWGTVLDDLAGTITQVRSESGPDGVGLYLATGLAYDSAGQVACGLSMAALGSSSFYTAATVDNAPVLVAAEQVSGNAMMNPVWESHRGGLLMLVGSNPVVSHGYGTTLADPVRRLREHREHGGRIVVIDPRRTETAAHADVHLGNRPGSDVILLAALARELLDAGADDRELADHCLPEDVAALRAGLEPFTISAATLATGLDQVQIEQLLDDLRGSSGRLAIFCGTGTTMGRDGVLVEWLRWVLLILTGSLDVEGGMRFNRGVVNQLRPPRAIPRSAPAPASRPDLVRVAGQVPAVAMVDEIEAGRLRVLVVAGGNPLSAFPEPGRLNDALRTLDALVVLDIAENEMTDLATHVLPVTSQLERADLALAEQVSFRSGMQFTDAVVAPDPQRRPVWWVLASLLRRLDLDILGGAAPEHLDDRAFLAGLLAHGPLEAAAVLDAGPVGVDLAPSYGWVRKEFLLGGRWRLAPAMFLERLGRHLGPEVGLVLIPRRENAWSNSVVIAGEGAESIAHVNPDDASAAGISEGGWAAISSAHGSMVVTVAIDPMLRPGCVSVTHGHPGASPGLLVSGTVDVDPLTAMPRASGLPITLRPLSG
jgi:anaerobic selenocysteine-containing dehydrogenase